MIDAGTHPESEVVVGIFNVDNADKGIFVYCMCSDLSVWEPVAFF